MDTSGLKSTHVTNSNCCDAPAFDVVYFAKFQYKFTFSHRCSPYHRNIAVTFKSEVQDLKHL